jgi:hypothetical protein
VADSYKSVQDTAWSNGLNMLVTVLNWGRLAGTWRGSLSLLDDVLPDGGQNGRPLPFCDRAPLPQSADYAQSEEGGEDQR